MSDPKTFTIPPGTPAKTCRGCPATIYWVKMPSGKSSPLNPDGTSHFATCPAADEFRKPKGQP